MLQSKWLTRFAAREPILELHRVLRAVESQIAIWLHFLEKLFHNLRDNEKLHEK